MDEVLVQCNTDLNNLLTGRAKARRLTLRRVRIVAECRPDGTWTTASLLPLPRFGDSTPIVVFEGASLELFETRPARQKRLELTDINLTLIPAEHPLANGDPGGPAHSPLRQFRGSLRSNLFAAAALEGQVDVSNWSWSARGTVEGLETSPEALTALPQSMAERVHLLSAFRGRTQLSVKAQGQGTAPDQCRFAASGVCEGRLEDSRLPQPLTDVRARFSCDNQSLRIEQATARAGEAELALSGELTGLAHGGPLRLRASAKHLLLDQRLSESLPREWRCLWDQFHPRGIVNVEVGLDSDGQTWSHDLSVECLDISLAYHRFPYPLDKVAVRFVFARVFLIFAA